jgi:two-component system response regulator FixJ
MMSEATVHVIDDDDEVRRALVFLLASVGIEAQAHASANDFLTGFPRGSGGCIVTDVRMPEMTGIDLLKQLKHEDVRVPVIVMTGDGDIPLAVEAMKIGALDFLEKPFDDELFIMSVRRALDMAKKAGRLDAERRCFRDRFETLSGVSAMSSTVSSPAIRTRSSRICTASAQRPWKSTGPMSWTR